MEKIIRRIKESKLFKIFFLAFLLRFVLIFPTFHGDVLSNMDWGIRFWQYGPADFYSQNVWSFVWPNQPPGTIYVFAFIRKLYEGLYQFFWQINLAIPLFPSNFMLWFEKEAYRALVKLPSALADLGIAWLIFEFLKEKSKKWAQRSAFIWLFNPITFYNSSVWGQTDAIVNFLALASFFVLLKRKPVVASVFLAASVFYKISLLILVPLFLVVMIGQKYKLRDYLLSFIIPLTCIYLLVLPFSGGKNPLFWLFEIYKDKVFTNQLHYLTANAFNIWTVFFGLEPKSDLFPIGPLQIKQWVWAGYLFFLTPALYLTYKKTNFQKTIIAAFLISYSSFILLTNMHERYLYPAVVYFTILIGFYPKLLWAYVVLSGIYLVNLYNMWWVPRSEILISFLTFGGKIIPRFLSLLNVVLFFLMLRHFFTLWLRTAKIKTKGSKK